MSKKASLGTNATCRLLETMPSPLPSCPALPRVSVIVPFRNAATTLGTTLASIAAQTVPDWEAILIDDASEDDGPTLAQAWATADPRFRLIRLKMRQGVARARNSGIAVAAGRFVAFLDADDRWRPEKLELQLPVLDDGCPLVCSAYTRVAPDGRPLRTVTPPARFSYRDALGGNPIACLTAIWDTCAFPGARMPDLPLHEDYAFWLMLLAQGAEARGLPQVLAEYRVSPTSHSGAKWRAACATWSILGAQPGLGPVERGMAFARYSLRALAHRI
jgi:teichuronic acid biosynthesis glycosyltransferase TuaG